MADAHFVGHGVDPEDGGAFVRAEIDVYEAFARKHCPKGTRGVASMTKICDGTGAAASRRARATNGDVAPRNEIFPCSETTTSTEGWRWRTMCSWQSSVARCHRRTRRGRRAGDCAGTTSTISTRKFECVAVPVSLGHRRGGAAAVWGGRASGALASLHGAGIGGGVGFDADRDSRRTSRDDPGRPDGGVFRAPARRGRRSRARGGVRLRASRGYLSRARARRGASSRDARAMGGQRRTATTALARREAGATKRIGDVAPTQTKIPSRYPCSSSSPISPPSANLPATRTSRSSSTDTIRRNLWTTWCSWRSLRPARGTVRCSATAGNFAVTSETPPKPPSPRWWNTWGRAPPRTSGTTSRSGAKNTVVMVRRVASVQRHRGGRVVVDARARRGTEEYALAAIDAAAARINRGVEMLAAEMTHTRGWELVRRADTPVGR